MDASQDEPVGTCALFGRCGGCSALDMTTSQYVAAKHARVADALEARGIAVPVAPMLRVPFASRRRATFTATADGAGTRVGYLAARSHDVVDVAVCPALDPVLAAALPAIRAIGASAAASAGRARLTATVCHNGVDVALITEPARRSRRGRRRPVHRPPLTTDDPSIVRLTVDGDLAVMRERPVARFDGVDVPFPPGAFLQATRAAEALLIALVTEGVGTAGAVVDAFCGLGTFAVPMTRTAKVTAVEVDGPALAALEHGMARATGRRSLATLRRDLMRDPLSASELAGADAVVFDPPRAGAEALCRALAGSKAARIVAVSCEPRTLARDLAILTAAGYKITQVTPVDQFVGTAHIEVVATLRIDP